MNKSLSTFMSIAVTGLILSVLLFGVVYASLSDKNTDNQRILQREYNLQIQGGE